MITDQQLDAAIKVIQAEKMGRDSTKERIELRKLCLNDAALAKALLKAKEKI